MSADGPPPERGSWRQRRKRRRKTSLHFVDRRRTYAGLLLLGAGVLLALAVGGSWWQAELIASSPLSNAQVQHVLVTFSLGGGTSCSTWRWPPSNPCDNVSATIPGTQGAIYAAANVAVVGLAIVAFADAVVLFAGIFGLNAGRRELRLLILLTLALALVASAVVLGTFVIGPGPQAGTYCQELSGDVTSCPVFFGSSNAGIIAGGCQNCYLLLSWGGGPAFYFAVAAAGFFAAAWWLLYVGRNGPFSRAEQETWAVSNRPLTLTGPGPGRPNMRFDAPAPPAPSMYAPPPATSPASPRFKLRSEPWTCPRCGRVNSAWAGMCIACQGPPPEQ